MTTVRLYGNAVGHGSLARVTAGLHHGLSQLGRLAGFVSVDAYNEEEAYPGHDAEIGLFIGNPNTVSLLETGVHCERWVMLLANSTWLPKAVVASVEKHATGFVTCSPWGQRVTRKYTKLPVSIMRLGVEGQFAQDAAQTQQREREWDSGNGSPVSFHVLHMASTTAERKGTRELLEAWAMFVLGARIRIPWLKEPTLDLVIEGAPGFWDATIRRVFGSDEAGMRTVRTLGRGNLSVESCAQLYRRHHLVVQPSRGEGFGCIPLEAAACGVPVILSDNTGAHEVANYLCSHRLTSGFVTTPSEEETSLIDDGPGVEAPTIDVPQLAARIEDMFVDWKNISANAMTRAPEVRQDWDWTHVTRRWFDERYDP